MASKIENLSSTVPILLTLNSKQSIQYRALAIQNHCVGKIAIMSRGNKSGQNQ